MNNYTILASFVDSPVVQHLGGLSPPKPPCKLRLWARNQLATAMAIRFTTAVAYTLAALQVSVSFCASLLTWLHYAITAERLTVLMICVLETYYSRPLLQVPRTRTAYGSRAFSSAVYHLSGTIFQLQSLKQTVYLFSVADKTHLFSVAFENSG